jgi:hypothetical protein
MSTVIDQPGTEIAVVNQPSGGELSTSMQQSMARHEIEGAIVIARRFPRNEDAAYGRVMKSCERWSFASMARYSYPRGGQQIEGPSVNLAREVARCWTNIRYGCDIVHDDDTSRTVRGWAWDVETNCKETQDATFKKLIYRKRGGWQTPDERDLRELTNKHGAICVRNCLLHLVPPDLIDEAMRSSKSTLEKDAAKDPDEARRKMIRAFSTIGVTVDDLEAHLGHPLKQATPTEITDLRGIWKSISDGNSVWSEYVKQPDPQKSEGAPKGATMDDLTKPQPNPQPDQEPRQREPGDEPFDPADEAATVAQWREEIGQLNTVAELAETRRNIPETISPANKQSILSAIEMREAEIRGNKGAKSNAKRDRLFDGGGSATEKGI